MNGLYASADERFVRETNAMMTPTLNSPMMLHRFGSKVAISLVAAGCNTADEFDVAMQIPSSARALCKSAVHFADVLPWKMSESDGQSNRISISLSQFRIQFIPIASPTPDCLKSCGININSLETELQ